MKIESQKTFYISARAIQEMIATYLTESEGIQVSPDNVEFKIAPRDARPHDDNHTTVMEHLTQAVVTVKTEMEK